MQVTNSPQIGTQNIPYKLPALRLANLKLPSQMAICLGALCAAASSSQGQEVIIGYSNLHNHTTPKVESILDPTPLNPQASKEPRHPRPSEDLSKKKSVLSDTSPVKRVGLDTMAARSQHKLWNLQQEHDWMDCTVKVSTSSGMGTGSLIQIGEASFILTARHVVDDNLDDAEISVKYRNGRKSKGAYVVSEDKKNDIAILFAWAPDDIIPAKIADNPVQRYDTITFAGLGGNSEPNCCIRQFTAQVSGDTNDIRIYTNTYFIPGDSGGGAFNEQAEIVGVIAGGKHWMTDIEVKPTNGPKDRKYHPTGPARACNLVPIKKLIEKLKTDKPELFNP